MRSNNLFLENKFIVPTSLRQEMLTSVHKPHFGTQKTKSHARQLFYWHLLNNHIEEFLSKCKSCQLEIELKRNSCKSHFLPWQYVSAIF